MHESFAIAIALFIFSVQNASAGNEQTQRTILGGDSVEGPALPAASTYKPKSSGHDQARALWAPEFSQGGYVGASTTADVDGHEQARRMIVK